MAVQEMTLAVDAEFRSLMYDMPADSRELLEASILAEGCRDALVVWRGLLIDGHNRHAICTEHDLPFDTVELDAADRDDVRLWIYKNQLARRNLTPFQRAETALRMEPLIAAKARQNQSHGQTAPGRTLSQKSVEAIDTQKETAKSAGVSHDTIHKAKVIAAKAPEEVKAKLRTGEQSINAAYTEIRRQEKEEKREERRDENRAKVAVTPDPVKAGAKFATIVLDPPWDWGDEGDGDQMGRARPTYGTMPFDRIEALPVGDLADTDCHIYLWVTNRSIPKGFKLLDAWGFRYVTCLTWVKASSGLVYRCRHCHNLTYVQGQSRTTGVRTGKVSSTQTVGQADEGESSENLPVVQEEIQRAAGRDEVLQSDVCEQTSGAETAGKKNREKGSQLQGGQHEQRLSIPVPAGSSDGEQTGVRGRASSGDVKDARQTSGKKRDRSPQESKPGRQSAEEPGTSQSFSAHEVPLVAAHGDMPVLQACVQCGGELQSFFAAGNPGLGNYFRGSTEQILFAVKGSQPLKRHDVGTWFAANRGADGHSSKPDEFFALVESCSPGPCLEMFSRRPRPGWTAWGAEV